MALKIYTPFERGQLAYRAGCSDQDFPEGSSFVAQKEWQEGWRQEQALALIYKNDQDKFNPDPTGGM